MKLRDRIGMHRHMKGQLMTFITLILFFLMIAELVYFAVLQINYNNVVQSLSVSASNNNYETSLQLSAAAFAKSSLGAAIYTAAVAEMNVTARSNNFAWNMTNVVYQLMKSETFPGIRASRWIGTLMGNLAFSHYNTTLQSLSLGIVSINQSNFNLYQTNPYSVSVSYIENVKINSSGTVYQYKIPVNASVSINGTPDIYYAQLGVSRPINFANLANTTALLGNTHARFGNSSSFVYGTIVNVPAGVTCAALTGDVPAPLQSSPFNSIVILATSNALNLLPPVSSPSCLNSYGGLITYNAANSLALSYTTLSIPFLVYNNTSNVLAYTKNGMRVLLYGPGSELLNIEGFKEAISNYYYYTSPFTPSYIGESGGNFFNSSKNGLFTFSSYGRTAASFNGMSYIKVPKSVVSVPTNIIAYATITLTNNQNRSTGSPFQQLLGINSNNYAAFEAANDQNVEFFYGNGLVIPSWIETGNSNTSSKTRYWLQVQQISGGGTETIYMGFAPLATNYFGSTSNYNVGEAPNLSPSYAQYDSGANVFNMYQQFAGTTCNGWSNSVAYCNNGIWIGGSSTEQDAYVLSPSQYPYSTSNIIDFYGVGPSSTNGNSLGIGYTNQYADASYLLINPFGQTGNFVGWGTEPISQGSTVALTANALGVYYSTSTSTQGSHIYSVYWPSNSEADFSTNYGSTYKYTTDVPLGQSLYIGAAGDASATQFSANWIRVRSYPPGGVMPSNNIGDISVGIRIPQLITVSLWVYPYVIQGEDMLQMQDVIPCSSATVHGYYMGITPTGKAMFGEQCYANVISTQTLKINHWYNLIGTYNGTSVDLYVNGELTQTLNSALEFNSLGNLYFGMGNDGNFIGMLADIQLYSSALTAQQAYQLYEEGMDGLPIYIQQKGYQIVDWWPLNGNANSNIDPGDDGISYNVVWPLIANYSRDSIFRVPEPSKPLPVPGISNCDTLNQCSNQLLPHVLLRSFPLEITEAGAKTAYFNSQGSFVDLPQNTAAEYDFANTLDNFSVAAWVRVLGLYGTNINNFVANGGCGANKPGYSLGITTSGKSTFIIQTNGAGTNSVTGGNILDGLWHHLVGVDANAVMSFYVDGVYQGNAILPAGNILATGANFTIGTAMTSTTSFCAQTFTNSSISNVQVYNSSLNANQVSQLYTEGVFGVPLLNGKLVGWWPLNGDANDYSGYGYNPLIAMNVSYVPFTGFYNPISIPSYGSTISGIATERESFGLAGT